MMEEIKSFTNVGNYLQMTIITPQKPIISNTGDVGE
jgi:hypothetical protein